MKTKCDHARRSGERGTAIIESALCLLMFMIFVFGIMEMGRFMSFQVTLTNAAREGARLAVLPLRGTDTLPGPTAVQTQVAQFLAANAIDPALATVTVTGSTIGPTTYTTVQVTAPYNVMTLPLFGTLGGLNMTLSGRSMMRNENSP